MTRVFFYHGAVDRIRSAAALIGKAYQQQKAILVYAPEAPMAAAIDHALWTETPTGFTPHVRADAPLAAQTPVLIASDLQGLAQDERLLNLGNEVPPGFSRFEILIEIIDDTQECRHAGRERYRFYKDRGYEIQSIDLAARRAT